MTTTPTSAADATLGTQTPKVSETLEQALHRISTTLVAKNQFVPALTELMQLATQGYMDNPQVWLHIGHIYTRMASWSDAIAALDTALTLNPKMYQAAQLKSLALFSLGQREAACTLIDEVVKKLPLDGIWLLRAYLHSHSSRDPALTLKVAQDWGRRFADPLTRKAKPIRVADRSPRKKLKIGYVTADFREHSVAFFMLPVLHHHNHEQFDIHVYSNGPWDWLTPQLRALVPNWLDVMDMTDEALVQRIRDDGIDVLVDLSGFTHGHRLGVFARRAAPVQATWLGYLNTLGMKAMDYRLVDPGFAPSSHAPFYSESLFQLCSATNYAPPTYSPLCETLPMLRNGYPTLLSPNSSAKITDEMLKVWARILHERPDARLIIMVKEMNADAAQADMQPRVEAAGMPLDRVSVMHQQPLNQFMELGHIADIMLDTSPLSGGTTTLHSLWMGMSVVTLDAERGVEACTSYVLKTLGWGGEIAQDIEGYVQATLDLMKNPERLLYQRQNARDLIRKSFLMDYQKNVEELEKAFQLMWINWLRGNKKILSVNTDLEALLLEME